MLIGFIAEEFIQLLALLHQIQHYLLEHYHISHVTVQMEYQQCPEDDCGITVETEPVHAHTHAHAHHH